MNYVGLREIAAVVVLVVASLNLVFESSVAKKAIINF